MHPPPPCRELGPQCRELAVTLRIGTFDDGPDSLDHEATWLLGHTQQITFGALRRQGPQLLVEAVLHIRCRHLRLLEGGRASCRAHGFEGPAPPPTAGAPSPRRLGDDRFVIVEHGRVAERRLPPPRSRLPVLDTGPNPCATAPCTTADHRRGAACCRDLQVEILCSRADTTLEALLRSRLSPYLCKISRETEDALEAETISACGYLDDGGRTCSLHGRTREDGRPAKPDLCTEWPPNGKGLHPGCVFRSGKP